jgi:hypothetical protein
MHCQQHARYCSLWNFPHFLNSHFPNNLKTVAARYSQPPLNVSFIPTVERREFCCISLRRAYRIAWKCQWHRRKGSWPELRYNPGIYFESQDNNDKLVCGTIRTRSGRMTTAPRYQNCPLYSVPFIDIYTYVLGGLYYERPWVSPYRQTVTSWHCSLLLDMLT